MAGPDSSPPNVSPADIHSLFIDAGVCHFRLQGRGREGGILFDTVIPSNGDLRGIIATWCTPEHAAGDAPQPILITGKLAAWVREVLGCGKTILPAAAAWLAARDRIRQEGEGGAESLAVVDISASGYLVVGVDSTGAIKNDLLLVNPHCGAGSGVNLDRIVQKLGLARSEVDTLLAGFSGAAGREQRMQISVRADRCGVFSSSATISDKNQGIPLDVALAVTLKSEVLKVCRKVPQGFDTVWLTGRFFHWQFARDCAEDYFQDRGVKKIAWDTDNTQVLESLATFAGRLGMAQIAQPDPRLLGEPEVETYPAFAALKEHYTRTHGYLRLPDDSGNLRAVQDFSQRSLRIGLDVGSTMAKVVLADADSGASLFFGTYSNAGDTIQTLQRVFQELQQAGSGTLRVRDIGITGSARYQVRQALEHIYPELAGRLSVLVENYAHARGSIALAREHVARLQAWGVAKVNPDVCILVDIGGEDTKITTLDLVEGELLNNAMNLKCSAGTGSLMDTLAAQFGMPGTAEACLEAQGAPQGLSLSATCAVFLMENARKLQIQGVPRAEILASANWAIVENMAHSLWPQVDLPRHAVVLLHGQTMCSDPLPLAVIHRLRDYLDSPVYGLVPPHPGHRACLGLIYTLSQAAVEGYAEIPLAKFLEARYEKRIIQCHGAACGDSAACCNRTHLTCRGANGAKPLTFTLGGCGAINELLAKSRGKAPVEPVRDTYQAIWDFLDSHLPRSDNPDRLVLPRSFVVSEWVYLLARVLEGLGVPVHVDNVREGDLATAQPLFNIDTCAPHMGAVGQYRRLAGEPHGIILAPQIETLPTQEVSRGWACTLNQGGVAVATNLAGLSHESARFHLFHLDLGRLEADALTAQLADRLAPVFSHYHLAPDRDALRTAIAQAIEDHLRLRREAADLAAHLAEEALAQGRQVALVVGREYVLNPGIYDSHVRRLLRDKHMAVLPSYILDMELNPDYSHIYWRNPHFIVSLLDAVSRRDLHQRLHHPGLRQVLQRIESGASLLPVIQISTFSCGPDSIIQPLIAEIMKARPFLLIQSDAAIKELAHLENRVNTHIRQLEQGPRQRKGGEQEPPFDIRTLDELDLNGPINRGTDVIYFPTLSDNRSLTSVLRGAGYTCIDNYGEDFNLHRLVRDGRRATGDAVCAPLAGVYAELQRAVDDFTRRRQAGDPLVAGKSRLLFFEVKGNGPCRQGLYSNVHQLLFQRRHEGAASACNALPGQGVLKLLGGRESEGFNIGLEEWVLIRAHQGVILQGVLHALLFTGGSACKDYDDFQDFLTDYRALKAELYRRLELHARPGGTARTLLRVADRLGSAGGLLKYLVYRQGGRQLAPILRQFARRWLKSAAPAGLTLRILLSGEIYMRVSQAEAIHRILLGHLGFRRFKLDYTPAWNYLEYSLDEGIQIAEDQIGRLTSRPNSETGRNAALAAEHRRIRRNESLRFLMRRGLARPLYRAAGLPMPVSTKDLLGAAREVLPTLRPLGELLTYVGEALRELRHGTDLLLNAAPTGCMVSSMGEALTPRLAQATGIGPGRIQNLFSADGNVDEEPLTLALLKVMGPEGYYRVDDEETRNP